MIELKYNRLSMIAVGVTALATTLCGCGGGGGGGTSNVNALQQGRAAIGAIATGQKPASQSNFHSAFDLFIQALQQNPNSSEAHFGAAISLVGFVGLEYDDVPSVPGGPESFIGKPPQPMPPAAPLSKKGVSSTPNGPITVADDVPPAPDGTTAAARALRRSVWGRSRSC